MNKLHLALTVLTVAIIVVPIVGVANLSLPAYLEMGASINASVSGGFQLPFWLAIVASAICIAARLYHGRVVAQKPSTPAADITSPKTT